jgi:hypothetical protein
MFHSLQSEAVKKIKIRPPQQGKTERAYPLVNYLKLQAFSQSNLRDALTCYRRWCRDRPPVAGFPVVAKLMETRGESVPRTGVASP